MYRLVCSKLFKSLGSFHLNFHWRRGHKVILVMPWLASEHQAVLVLGAFQLQFELDTLKDGDDSDDGRNPAPVDRWFIPLFIGFQPSKVVQDFFHPP